PATTDLLIPPRSLVRQAHLHANFGPLGHKRVGDERDAPVVQMEDFVENGGFVGTVAFQLRVKHSRVISLSRCHLSSQPQQTLASPAPSVNDAAGNCPSPLDYAGGPSQSAAEHNQQNQAAALEAP